MMMTSISLAELFNRWNRLVAFSPNVSWSGWLGRSAVPYTAVAYLEEAGGLTIWLLEDASHEPMWVGASRRLILQK